MSVSKSVGIDAVPTQAVPAAFFVYPFEQLLHMEAPFVVQAAPVLATPLAHLHWFAAVLIAHTVRVVSRGMDACMGAVVIRMRKYG